MSTWIKDARLVDLCILANVDDSITNLHVSESYELVRVSTQDILNKASQVLSIPPTNLFDALSFLRYYPRENPQLESFLYGGEKILAYLYAIRRTSNDFKDKTMKSDFSFGEANNAFQLARLMVECNPTIPISIQYAEDIATGDLRDSYGGRWTHIVFPHKPLALTGEEWERLNYLNAVVKLPFEDKVLDLAQQNFEISYGMNPLHLNFLSVMIGFEVLMGADNREIVHQIARNVAVLLSEDNESGEKIYKDIKSLYDIRSRLVHDGKASKLTISKMLEARRYLGRLILRSHEINLPMDELRKLLNASGYGDFYK